MHIALRLFNFMHESLSLGALLTNFYTFPNAGDHPSDDLAIWQQPPTSSQNRFQARPDVPTTSVVSSGSDKKEPPKVMAVTARAYADRGCEKGHFHFRSPNGLDLQTSLGCTAEQSFFPFWLLHSLSQKEA